MTFSDKIKVAREQAGLTQQQLADSTGVSKRTIASYESGGAIARASTMLKLAKALNISSKYLSDDSCLDPMADIEKDGYLEEARERYGSSGARDVDQLLRDNGELSQEQKDQFFEAVMRAYVACKDEAKVKFGRKNK